MMIALSRSAGSGLAALALALALGVGAALPAQAQVNAAAATALAEKHMCLACHKIDARSVGPSFREIAAKYAGDAGAADKMLAKVKNGGRGAWGNVPMPPNKDVPDDDIKAIVVWVLSVGR